MIKGSAVTTLLDSLVLMLYDAAEINVGLESSHQATRRIPSSDLRSQDECSLCLDSAVARQFSKNNPSFE
jgi:hypothetical protein